MAQSGWFESTDIYRSGMHIMKDSQRPYIEHLSHHVPMRRYGTIIRITVISDALILVLLTSHLASCNGAMPTLFSDIDLTSTLSTMRL